MDMKNEMPVIFFLIMTISCYVYSQRVERKL